MSDRELTVLAAKAAGIAGEWDEGFAGFVIGELDGGHRVMLFDPLDDDGDALRLAVKRKLIVTFADGGAGPHVLAGPRLGPFVKEPLPILRFGEQEPSDLAATRRAIVRAAAEIGKAMS